MSIQMIILLLLGAFALKGGQEPGKGPAQPMPQQPRHPLDPNMDPQTFAAVWNAYYRCADANQLRGFAASIPMFPVGAKLLQIRASQLAPPAPVVPMQAQPAPAPAPVQTPPIPPEFRLPPLIAQSISALSFEQYGAYVETLKPEERAKIEAELTRQHLAIPSTKPPTPQPAPAAETKKAKRVRTPKAAPQLDAKKTANGVKESLAESKAEPAEVRKTEP
jgi:hypothetical protein